jgi:hypothetical protein
MGFFGSSGSGHADLPEGTFAAVRALLKEPPNELRITSVEALSSWVLDAYRETSATLASVEEVFGLTRASDEAAKSLAEIVESFGERLSFLNQIIELDPGFQTPRRLQLVTETYPWLRMRFAYIAAGQRALLSIGEKIESAVPDPDGKLRIESAVDWRSDFEADDESDDEEGDDEEFDLDEEDDDD